MTWLGTQGEKMSQGCEELRTSERDDEATKLMRVGVPVRAGASATGVLETPEGRLDDEAMLACEDGKVIEAKPMGGGELETTCRFRLARYPGEHRSP